VDEGEIRNRLAQRTLALVDIRSVSRDEARPVLTKDPHDSIEEPAES